MSRIFSLDALAPAESFFFCFTQNVTTLLCFLVQPACVKPNFSAIRVFGVYPLWTAAVPIRYCAGSVVWATSQTFLPAVSVGACVFSLLPFQPVIVRIAGGGWVVRVTHKRPSVGRRDLKSDQKKHQNQCKHERGHLKYKQTDSSPTTQQPSKECTHTHTVLAADETTATAQPSTYRSLRQAPCSHQVCRHDRAAPAYALVAVDQHLAVEAPLRQHRRPECVGW